jgi:hypothetical protein
MMRKINIAVLLVASAFFVVAELGSLSGNANAQEIGFLEEFVLASDRDAVLKKLVPGTERYYYFHALHQQNNQNLEEVEQLLKPWVKRFGKTQSVKKIMHRQALLKYSSDPKSTLDYLTDELNLYFAHQREIPQTQRDLASKFDQKLLAQESLLKAALRQKNTRRITDSGLRLLAGKNLSKTQRRHLLQRLSHPDFPQLVDLIVADLKERDSSGFGSIKIHRLLTVKQLDELAKQYPKVKALENYVTTYLSKLVPSEDIDWRADREEHRNYLDRLWAFVQPLNPNFNSLKACILFRRLDLDLQDGVYDRQRFMTYLKLPRQVSYINPLLVKNVQSRSHIANLGANYSALQLLPVSNDEPLIQAYLQHFLLNAQSTKPFEPYVRDKYLNREFAIVKIVNGIGDTEKWASMLSPEEYKQVLDRIDVEFLSTNPEFFKADDAVELELFLKNVDNLIVKVFEINTQNYYRKHKSEIDTDINLDGLVPNFEETYEYDVPPALRKTYQFKFPQLNDRGVYVIDFIAGGKSSRALIRKGRLQVSDRVTPMGQEFTVFNQSGEVVKDANLWIAGARYNADKGKIQVPFSTTPGQVNAIITQGGFSCLQTLKHMPEKYQFKAAMVVDRENLTRSNKARVLIRPSLQIVGGNPVPVSLLKNPKLVVTSQNLDGISSTKVIDNLEFTEKEETICEFVVPPRLKTITLSLTAEIKVVSKNQIKNVGASQVFSINAIDQSDVIQDIHLLPTSRGYFLEMLGKSGEIRRKQAVRVQVSFYDFTTKTSMDLQSDEKGLIELGPLTNVRSVTATPAGGKKKEWQLATQDQTYYQTVHAESGDTIEFPAPANVIDATREHISLMETRRGNFVADLFDSVRVKDGLVKIAGLAVGDYQLRLTYPTQRGGSHYRNIVLRVTDGKQADNVLVGKHRHLESRGTKSLHVAKVTTNNDKIRVQLDNADDFTRVHVVANRYQPAFNAFNQFSQIADLEPWQRSPSIRRSVYMEGRKIGDEYEYILRRKYAKKFPGNMLERPSLLLNPWEVRETNNSSQVAATGDDFGRTGNAADGGAGRGVNQLSRKAGNTDFANLDYLGESAVLLANLKPQKNGIVSIDRKLLGPNQHVRIVVLNTFNTIQRNIDLPLMKLVPEDARLAHALDPDKHFSQSKQTQVLKTGDTLLSEDIISAKFQQYDDLGDVYQLMLTLNSNTNLSKFEFVLTWDDKPKKEKNELYSKFACHELNFFLMKKDPEFFAQVIVPHLKNKRDKTFMDKWLLKENLDAFVSPWNYPRLNTVEKILLAQRLETQSSDIVRNIGEQYRLTPTSRAQLDGLYDTTIRGLGLMGTTLGRESRGRKDKSKLPQMAGVVVTPTRKPGEGKGQGGFGGGRSFADDSTEELGAEPQVMFEADIDASDAFMFESESINGKKMDRKKYAEVRIMDEMKKLDDRTIEYRVQNESGRGKIRAFVPNLSLIVENRDENYQKLYQRLGPTKEWMENNYYQLLPEQQSTGLVQTNRFWRDYANHEGGTFLSPHFSEANRTFTEMMFALSVLDLPLEEPKQNFEYADNSMTFTAGGPTIALHQQVRDAIFERGNTTILVSENFFQKNDRYRHEDGVQFDKFISGDFLAHTLYGSQVVITNPTSTPRAVDLLIQIPLGSVSCSGSQETRTIQMDLAAFSTKTFEYAFYFPTAGDFEHYPAHVSSEEKVLAVADDVTFKVIDRPAEVDETSWAFVSQNGTEDQVIEFLNQENILRLDLGKIAFRMKDKPFFERAIETLRNRYVYEHTLWSYAVKHNNLPALKEYLTQSQNFVANCGLAFDSELVSINPVERNWYAHKEYWPLVNDRAHQLGPNRKILNPNFFAQYQQLLSVLSNRRELTSDDHLVVAYYMLLQDRIETALSHFDEVSRDGLSNEIQYDYCDAYLDMYRENPDDAATKAAKWADYPVDLWRNRFQHILAQVDEIKGGDTTTVDEKNNSQQQTEASAKSESFDFEVESGIAKIKYQNVDEVMVNIYEMDVELLFSRSPFTQDELDGFSMIRPNFTKSLKLKANDNGKGSHEYTLPEEMQNKNVLVEVVAGDQTKSQPYFAHSLDVQVLEKFGQVHVTSEASGKAIPKTYVKVYSRMQNGSVRFHKDGYTDLRGRFDFVSQSNKSIDGIKKFSILILSEAAGAVIRQADPPKE